MAYQRKLTKYGASIPKAPSTTSPPTTAEPDGKDSELSPERSAEVLQWAAANPELSDLERYDRSAFASPGRRFLAYLLDCVIVVPTMLVMAWALGTLPGLYDASADRVGWFGLSPRTARLLSSGIQLLLYDTYFTSTVFRWGGTWGQKFLGIIVLRRDLAKPTRRQARWRYWSLIVSLIPVGLGALAIFWDARRRGWHDRISGTYVLRLSHAPGDLVEARSSQTRDPGETAKDARTTTGCLMFGILLIFAPGLIVLGLLRLLLGKLGLIKKQVPKEPLKAS